MFFINDVAESKSLFSFEVFLTHGTLANIGKCSLLYLLIRHFTDSPKHRPDPISDWGEIVSFLPENNMVVLFTDYGNKEILSMQNIRTLEEKFKEEPPFAICCHVTGILPAGGKDWTQTASQFLKDKLSDLDCYINQKGDTEDGSLPVDLLYELTGQEMIDRNTEDELDSISELLIKEGLALRDRKKVAQKSAQSPIRPGAATSPAQSPGAKPSVNGETTSPLRINDHVSQASNDDASEIKLTEDSVKHSTPENRMTKEATDNHSNSPQSATPELTTPVTSSPREKRSKKKAHAAKKLDISISPSLGMEEGSPNHSADKSEVSRQDVQKHSIDSNTLSLEQTEAPVINDSGDSGIVNTDHGNTEGTSVDTVDFLKDSERDREKDDTATSDGSITHPPDKTERTELSGGDSVAVNGLSVGNQKHEETNSAQQISQDPSVEEGGLGEDLAYLPPGLPEKEQFVIVVTFVSNEGLIYGLEMEKFSVFQSMMADIQEYFKTRQQALPTATLKLNQSVCAKFSADNQWYRATVINVMPDSAEVQYIDFGNTEVVSLDQIDVRPFEIDLPQQSICCQLYGITPTSPDKRWTSNAIQVLAQMITEQTCTVTVKEVCEVGKPVAVNLILPSGDNASDLLVKHGLVTSVKAPQQQLGGVKTDGYGGAAADDYGEEIFDEDDEYFDSSECSKISLNHETLRDMPPIQYQPDSGVLNPKALLVDQAGGDTPFRSLFKPLQFPLGWIEFLAEVPCIESPDLVYLQYSTTFKDGPYQDHDLMLIYEKFIKLHAEVNKLAHTFPDIEIPKPGMPCLAHYKSDKQWYRGEILAVEGGPDLYCSVRFVDYGTVESLPLERICHLPEKYLDLPTQCRLCKIEGLKPPSVIPPGFPVSETSNWPVASSNAMLQLIKNKIFLATILEDGPIPIISLYSTQFVNGGIQRGSPMFLSLIETGLADVGVGFSDYTRNKLSYSQ